MQNNREEGLRGEQAACEFLKTKGYKIVARNVSYKMGEMDIVALKKNTLVFIEVKTRENTCCGRPIEAVNAAKCRKYCKMAEIFTMQKKYADYDIRFDVIEILQGRINHIENAFDASYF